MIGALLLALSTAHASPCEDAGDGFPVGPVSAPLGDGALGAPRRTCPRSEVGLAGVGDLTADTANFYGYIVANVVLDGSWAVRPQVELTARVEAFRLDLGIATLTSTSLGLGNVTLGAAWGQDVDEVAAVGVRANLVVPTATPLYANGRPFGAEVQVTSVQAPHRILRVHEGIGGRMVAAAGGPADPAGGLSVFAGLEVRPVTQFGVVVDVDASFFLTELLDHVAVAPALRFGDGKRFGFELGGRLPLLGRERSLLSAELKGTVRLGPIQAR